MQLQLHLIQNGKFLLSLKVKTPEGSDQKIDAFPVAAHSLTHISLCVCVVCVKKGVVSKIIVAF